MNTEKDINVTTKQTKENKDLAVIQALRARCEDSKTFNSMCHVFALRERTRRQITLTSFQQAMMKEGFKFTKQQYAEELKFMAALGLGKLSLNKKGVITALTNISVTLQSIGLVAVSKRGNLAAFLPSQKYTPLDELFDTASVSKKLPKLLEKKSPPVANPEDFQAYLTFVTDGKIMQFDLLPGFSTKELVTLMIKATRGVK